MGVAGAIGGQLNRDWSIEGSARFRGPISRPQDIDIAEAVSFTTTHSEFAFEGLVVYTPVSIRRVRVEPLVGVALVRGVTEHQQVVSRPFECR